jgi:CRP/FNR family transcriptional regulator
MKVIYPPLFHSDLNATIDKIGQVKVFPAGTVIQNINAYIKSIPIVLSGSIKVIRTDDDGREILLYYIRAGESCIMSFLAGMHNDTSKVKAVVEEDATLLMIPSDKAGQLIREFPEWTDFIFNLYHKRFEELLEVVNAVAFRKIDERLLDFIQKKCELTQSRTLSMTHEQIANELGTARVVVSRLLKQMEEAGLVRLGRNKITVN